MTSLTIQDRRGNPWLVIRPSSLAVAALLAASIIVALASLLLTAHRGPPWPALVVVFLALIALALPDGWAGLATLFSYGTWWLFAVRDTMTPWALPAALALLTFHVALAHDAAGPTGIAIDRATVLRTFRDGALVVGVTALVAVVVVSGQDVVSTVPSVVGLTLLLIVLVSWLASRSTQPTTERGSE